MYVVLPYAILCGKWCGSCDSAGSFWLGHTSSLPFEVTWCPDIPQSHEHEHEHEHEHSTLFRISEIHKIFFFYSSNFWVYSPAPQPPPFATFISFSCSRSRRSRSTCCTTLSSAARPSRIRSLHSRRAWRCSGVSIAPGPGGKRLELSAAEGGFDPRTFGLRDEHTNHYTTSPKTSVSWPSCPWAGYYRGLGPGLWNPGRGPGWGPGWVRYIMRVMVRELRLDRLPPSRWTILAPSIWGLLVPRFPKVT